MSPKPSPDRDITELFNRHRVTNIPSDQKELLERPDSWAVELENTPHGLSHLPGHVLETVKATYVANKHTIQERTPISKKRSGSPITSPSNKRKRNGITSTPRSDHAKPPQSSPERAVSSWSPTPERIPSKDADCIAVAIVDHNTQSSIVHETPKPGFGRPQRPISKSIIENPPSSGETEDDLETRIPDAQPLHNGSVNRTAVRSKPTAPSPLSTNRTMATPPCAQPSNTAQTVVPNTVFTNKENMRGSESPKTRRLRFKPIDMDGVGWKRRKGYNEKDRLPPTTMPPKVVGSSMPASSDSIIPFTGIPSTQESVRDIRESIEMKEEDETMDHIEEVVPSTNFHGSTVDRPAVHGTDEKKPSDESKPIQQPTTSSQMGSSKATAATNSQPQINDQMMTEKPPAPAPLIAPGAPLEPYEAFVQQYPDYPGENGGDKLPGTKSNFIYACVYLNYLRPRKQLRDCLYDEFIRAYPCSYGEYVKRSRMEPMVAIKWFNQQKGPLVYNKYLVNRGNLSHILRSYPEEFARANELVSKKSGDDAGGDDIMIYTSSEDEGEFDEDDSQRSVSPSSQRSSERESVESPQPIATIENDMEIDLPEVPSAPPSTSSKRRPSLASTNDLEIVSKPMPTTKPITPAQSNIRRRNPASERRPLQCSRVQEILTQPPPPTSPQMSQTSMLPPSTIGGSAIKSTAPRPSQYFKKISADLLKATPKKRSAKDLEKLREHFRRSKGTGAQDRRSSSGRFE
ncbi:hypothetical protein Forpe1208_v000336 [Fusarium oxysporum f. sp. rapae]|uniref:Uncharacterized protein n=1 Tax=Fusarium oxysporum f. sp. rapae TaxID=485398 RepID=A0A8J5U1H6_FUSOX|nr:hypothetical protein Forpe1208_v000336 [Fusarium oxysporum f. sp. rapae]